mmetsp:Transcript_3588/g.22515  ORF Transcript_3588/g.22515 Transcript_3588/m.22515 type:complete len:148 (+) Transcript_3588:1845-2288(+)
MSCFGKDWKSMQISRCAISFSMDAPGPAKALCFHQPQGRHFRCPKPTLQRLQQLLGVDFTSSQRLHDVSRRSLPPCRRHLPRCHSQMGAPTRSLLRLNLKPTLVHAKLEKTCTTRANIGHATDGQDDRDETMVLRQRGMRPPACGCG